MRELLPVRINLGNQLIVDVELQVIAIRTHHRFREADRRVAASPMESWLKHDFLRRVALGLIESRSWLRLAENVRDSVIADAIARTEIAVRIVIKGTPADSSSVLRV